MSRAILEFIKIHWDTMGIEDIDKKIQSLQGDIDYLQQFRRSRIIGGRIVAALPNDILLIIFDFVHQFLKTTYSFVCDWTRLTHVCQRWRNIILDSPPFWTTIETSMSTDMARLWIERSGNIIPLHLQLLSTHESARTVSMLLREQTHRWETIAVCPWDDFHYKDDLERITQAPNLEMLKISIPYGSPLLQGSSHSPLIQFAPITSPRFHSLSLGNVSVDLNMPCFSQLRVLKLRYSERRPPESLQLHPLLRLLASMERLEEISLDDAINTSGSGGGKAAHVTLPYLRRLSFIHTQINGFGILSHLSCPSIKLITVQVLSALPSDHASVTAIAKAFYSLIPPPVHQYYTRLGYKIDWSSIFSMVSIWPIATLGIPPFCLSVIHKVEEPANHTMFSAIYPPTSLPVTTLEFESSDYNNGVRDTLHSFLQTLPAQIDTLIVHDCDCALLVLSLVPYAWHILKRRRMFQEDFGRKRLVEPSQYTSLLPSLRHIGLYHPHSYYVVADDMAVQELQDLLQARKSAGVGIETLKIWCREERYVWGMRTWEANIGSIATTPGKLKDEFGHREE